MSATAVRRILLLVDHRRNRELLEAWVADEPTLELAGRDDRPDVVVCDGPAFARERDWLRHARLESVPEYLPCLLTTPHAQVSVLTSDLWRDVDELITTPIRQNELRVRLERVLQLRARSLDVASRLAELGRSNTDLQQFAYVAAHELSTPLSVVIGVIETVTARYSGAVPEDVANLLTAASLSSHRLRHLIDDLLAYSRAGHAVAMAPISLADVLRDALVPLAPQVDLTGAEVDAGELPTVFGDAPQLRLVFSNLLGNAIKYRRPGVPPRIRVSASREDDKWCICVEDNGIGIDPQRAQAVFEMFERERPDGDRPGSGIGLALCKRIVERHDGEIWIEPGDDGGTRVKFSLRAA